MDGVALAAVIGSSAVGLAGVGIVFWKDVKLAREKRLSESYLEVLRIVEHEGQWIEDSIRKWEIAAEPDEFVVDPDRVMMPRPAITDQADAIAVELGPPVVTPARWLNLDTAADFLSAELAGTSSNLDEVRPLPASRLSTISIRHRGSGLRLEQLLSVWRSGGYVHNIYRMMACRNRIEVDGRKAINRLAPVIGSEVPEWPGTTPGAPGHGSARERTPSK